MIWSLLPFLLGVFGIGTLVTLVTCLPLPLCWYWPWLRKKRQGTRGRIWYRLLVFVLGIWFAFSGIVTGLILTPTLTQPPQEGVYTVVVLGCRVYDQRPSLMLARRLDAAAAYLKENPDALCIVSGGHGSDEPVSEAQVMAQYLLDCGVAESRIFQEEQAATTMENLRFSEELAREVDLPQQYIIVSDGYHLYRSGLLARRAGLFVVGNLPTDTPWYMLEASLAREILAVTKAYLVQ